MDNHQNRINSVDVFRAVTMLLMIFVNDFGTLTGVPYWLKHAPADEDFLGFSDLIFPCFLFIVGMAIPYAIRNRLAKGESHLQILRHIVLRSFALLVMGLFTVNCYSLNASATGLSRAWFEILMVTGFFLIWNSYPKLAGWKKYLFPAMQLAGAIILIWLYSIFRGGKDGTGHMTTSWWGILGLIGWAYLLAAPIYLFARKSPALLILGWVLFTLLHIGNQVGWIHTGFILAYEGFAFAGIAATLLIDRASTQGQRQKLPLLFLGAGVLLLIAGFGLRNFFVISKLHQTPTWVFICNGIAFGVLALIYFLVDLKGKANWFHLISPAGASTLTCYLVPYYYYGFAAFALTLPDFLKTGTVGLLKSLVFAMIIIGITALLGKIKIKLMI
jgi:hypothetical protein